MTQQQNSRDAARKGRCGSAGLAKTVPAPVVSTRDSPLWPLLGASPRIGSRLWYLRCRAIEMLRLYPASELEMSDDEYRRMRYALDEDTR